MTTIRNGALIAGAKNDFRQLNNPLHAWGDAASFYQSLSKLRGFWPMSSVNESGNVYDLSGQGRTLTNNSSTAFGVTLFTPYADFDGAADYLSRPTEAGLEITSNLTLCCWAYFDNTASAIENVIGKRGAGGQLGYYIRRTAGGLAEAVVSSNGTAATLATGGTLAEDTWYFLALRYLASTELSIWVNDTETLNTTSIPASIHNSTADFTIGANGTPGEYMNGRIALPTLCATDLGDDTLIFLYDMTRHLFGV